MNKKKIMKLCAIPAIILVAILGIFYMRYSDNHPATDDAYVSANIVTVASSIPGTVNKLAIQNHQFVKKGQLLYSLDPRPFQYAVGKAKANLLKAQQFVASLKHKIQADKATVKQQQAAVIVAKARTNALLPLVKQHYQSVITGDDTLANMAAKRQALIIAENTLVADQKQLGNPKQQNSLIALAKASLASAQYNLNETKQVAKGNGYISQLSLRPGDQVSVGAPLFTLIESKYWWVTAYFKETQIANIRPNQPATVSIDIYNGKSMKGIVERIGYASGNSFSLLPEENGSGNWVKVTQRFPVKIRLPAPAKNHPYRVGASATVTIDTKG